MDGRIDIVYFHLDKFICEILLDSESSMSIGDENITAEPEVNPTSDNGNAYAIAHMIDR